MKTSDKIATIIPDGRFQQAPFTTVGRFRADLNPVETDTGLQTLVIDHEARRIARSFLDNAHFERALRHAFPDPDERAAYERRLRPYLPWNDANPPAVPIAADSPKDVA